MFENNTDHFLIEKLSILYVLKNTSYDISDTNLTQIILGTDIMEYFKMMSLIPEMINLKFITTYKKDDFTIYAITQSGLEVVNNFDSRIPKLVKDRIDQYLFVNKNQFTSNIIKYEAKYIPDLYNSHVVNLIAKKSNKDIIEINIVAKSEKEALDLCHNWKNTIEDKYSIIKDIILNKN